MVKRRRTCQALSKREPTQVRPGKTSRLRRGRCSQRSTGAGEGTRCPVELRWRGDRNLFTAVIYDDRSAYEWQDAWSAGSWWQTRVPELFLASDVDGADLFALYMVLRIARASPEYVTDSSFVELGVSQPRRTSTVEVLVAWAGLWRNVSRELDAWVGLKEHLSVRKVKAHPPLRLCTLGSPLPMIGLAVCWLMLLASRCFFDAPCPALMSGWQRHSPNQAVTCVAHWIERVGSARQRLDIDGSGCLDEGERRHANMSRCGRGRSPTTAKDTVLPMKHCKTCALLGVGETWTQKRPRGTYPRVYFLQFVQPTVKLALFSKWPLCFDMRD